MRSRLEKQDSDGEDFFNDAETGAVVDLQLHMTPSDWEYQRHQGASYEVYRPFQRLSVLRRTDQQVLAELTGGGRMRPRGQSTMALSVCYNTSAMPFLIDLTSESTQQRLFGMERFYLRNHMSDPSGMREWTMHCMLRRFGLPYLRNRIARFFVKDRKSVV